MVLGTLALVLCLWTVAAPQSASLTNLLWASGSAITLSWILLRTLNAGSPTRSIAHVLYETEQGTTRRD